MSKNRYRRIRAGLCIATVLAAWGPVIMATSPAKAQTLPIATTGAQSATTITPEQFLQNASSLLQGNVGENVVSLLQNGISADQLTQFLSQNTNAQIDPNLMNAVMQAAQNGGLTPQTAASAITGMATNQATAAVQQALSSLGMSSSEIATALAPLTAVTGTSGTTSGNSSGSSSSSGGSGQSKDNGDYRVKSMPVDADPSINSCNTCSDVGTVIRSHYREVRQTIKDEFIKHRNWIVNTYWKEHVLPALMLMAEQLTAVGIAQVEMIGAMLDAKHQLETQRLFQQLTAQAHKDYHPSEGMCTFGTNVRSLAASERKSDLVQVGLASRMMQRQTLNGDVVSFEGNGSDTISRIERFRTTYCDKADNANGLDVFCKDANSAPERRNIDVDFTRNVESRLTLNIDLTLDAQIQEADLQSREAEDSIQRAAAAQRRDALQAEKEANKADLEDIYALSANLFSNNVAPKITPEHLANDKGQVRQDGAERLLDLRSVYAKRSVAQNSFAALTAMRAAGDEGSAPYTKALLKELGINSQDEIEKILGEKPSYFAQMEVLTKKIYQNPSFYTELYDKPVNVERKGAAIEAISLMQDRDLYNSLLRSEAVLSVLLETMLMKEQSKVVNAIPKTD